MTDLVMPQLAMSMTEGKITEWLVPDGAAVLEGQAIYTIEADKATQEIESPVAGVLKQLATEGETYDVGAKVGEIG